MVCGFAESCCLWFSHPSFSEAANGFILPCQTHFFWRPKGQSPETFDLAMSQKQALNRAEESFRHLSGIRLFSWVRQWHARPATLLIWWVVVDVCLCLIPYFQVNIAAVTFTFPLKTFLSSTIIQFVFFDEIDTENDWFVQIFNIKEIVGSQPSTMTLTSNCPFTFSCWPPTAGNCSLLNRYCSRSLRQWNLFKNFCIDAWNVCSHIVEAHSINNIL